MRQAYSIQWKKTVSVRTLFVLAMTGLLAASIALAQTAGQGLTQQLMRRYRISRATLTPEGAPATEPGQIYHLRRGGLLAFAGADRDKDEICPAIFRGGALHVESGALCRSGRRKVLSAADPVCITAISVNEKNDDVSFYLIECKRRGAIVNAYHAKLIFGFPRGSIASLSATRIAPVIAGMLTAGKDTAETEPKPAAEMKKPKYSSAEEPTRPAEANAPAEAADKEETAHQKAAEQTPVSGQDPVVGQTMEQVTALRGMPELAANLDKRLIWIYPDGMRVIFVEGKVSKVEQPENHE